MSRAQNGSLAGRQGGIQVFTPADLDQSPQGPGPAPQSHHVDRLAGGEPEPGSGELLRSAWAEFVPEQLPQVMYQRGAFPVPGPEVPVAAPAGDAIAQGCGKAGHDGRRHRPVGHAFHGAQQPLRAALIHVRPLLSRLSHPDIGTGNIDIGEMLPEQVRLSCR